MSKKWKTLKKLLPDEFNNEVEKEDILALLNDSVDQIEALKKIIRRILMASDVFINL